MNLTIGQGELVGIVGPSGSGKTTLLQLMGTLDRPTSGQVRITGLDVAAMADEDVAYLRATRIGFIFQQFFLAEHSTVLGQRRRRAALRRHPHQAAPPARPRRPRAGRPGRASRMPVPPSSPAGNANASRSPGPWSASPPSCWPTSRPATSTRPPGTSILALIDQLHQAGSTIVVITHDHAIAERMPRKVEILDGQIVADTGPAAGTAPSASRHPPPQPVQRRHEEPS